MSKDNINQATETILKEKSFAEKSEVYDKAVRLIAGAEGNINAIVDHYKYLEEFTQKYLASFEEKMNITFDSYIADLLLVELLVNDMATFIGHMKVLSATTLSKMSRGELTDDQQDKAFLRILKVEKDFEKIKDEEYYEIALEKNVKGIIKEAKVKNLEGVFTYNTLDKEGEENVESIKE